LNRPPTINDVAAAAGVSVSTVSRVVRNHSDVKSETRAVVLDTIRDLDYVPSSIARAMVSGRTKTIGLPKSVEREASRNGYTVFICNTEDSQVEVDRHLRRLLSHGIDGIIHASVGDDEETVSRLMGSPRRVVFTNRRPRSQTANYIVSDNEGGAEELTRYLLGLGYRRVGFVGGPTFASNAAERLRGFSRVMEAEPGATALVAVGSFDPEAGVRIATQWLSLSDPPEAIVGVNDAVALGVVEAILRSGRRIPDDVAVAGFDDIQLASANIVGLTSISQHIEYLGERAFQILLQQISGEAAATPLQEVIAPTLQIRHTTELASLAWMPKGY